MAIQKEILSQYGVNAVYWNIAFMQNNFLDKVFYAKVFGYASKEAREALSQPVTVVELRMADDQYPGDIDRNKVYELIKTMPEFEGYADLT